MSVRAAPGRLAVWAQGARPRTLGASVVPVLAGVAAAGGGSAMRALGALAVAVALQVGVNYANDYFDGTRGIDTTARVGPVRLVASGLATPRAVARAAALAFGVAAALGVVLAAIGGWWLLAIGGAGILAAVGYSGGPRPYAALGLGEISVFTFFGLAATCGTAYLLRGRVPAVAWWAAVPVGLLAVALLVANNLRDIPTDTAAGKRTLAVRLGPVGTRAFYGALIAGAFAVVAGGAIAGPLPHETLLALAALPLAIAVVRRAARAGRDDLLALLPATAGLHAVAGLLLALGLWIA